MNRHLHYAEFVFSSLARSTNLFIFSLSYIFPLCSAGTAKYTGQQFLCLSYISTKFRLLAGTRWSVCSQNLIKFYESHFLVQILVCAYTIWKYDQKSNSCIIPNRSPFHLIVPNLVQFCVSLRYNKDNNTTNRRHLIGEDQGVAKIGKLFERNLISSHCSTKQRHNDQS